MKTWPRSQLSRASLSIFQHQIDWKFRIDPRNAKKDEDAKDVDILKNLEEVKVGFFLEFGKLSYFGYVSQYLILLFQET